MAHVVLDGSPDFFHAWRLLWWGYARYMECSAENFTISYLGTNHLKNKRKYFVQRFNFEKTRFLCCQTMPSRTRVLWFVNAKTACISRTRWVKKSVSSAILHCFWCIRKCKRRPWPMDYVWRIAWYSFGKACSQERSQIVLRAMFSFEVCCLSFFFLFFFFFSFFSRHCLAVGKWRQKSNTTQ